MKQLTCGSLFAGIGGFDLGFERAGIKTIWQVEIDEYCRRVLARHFPDARRYHNIRRVKRLAAVDIIAGGFPCQDISNAGNREGIRGKRSGLWSEYLRIIRLVRPRYVVVENVAALLNRGIDVVLGDLAESGFDAEWDVLPACAFGAPHIRERIWLVAYPSQIPTNTESHLRGASGNERPEPPDRRREIPPDSTGIGHSGPRVLTLGGDTEAHGARKANHAFTVRFGHQWAVEPAVGRVANGVPDRAHRLKALGNAIVPQIAEWIGRRIIEAESQ